MTSGGSSFEQGEDFVAARLSFDIPTDGIASLREITQEVDRFRTAVESASRGDSNFVGHLSQIAEAATRANTALANMSETMNQQGNLAGRQATGSSSDLNAPPQYNDVFAGMTLGTGASRNIPTAPQVQNQLDDLRNTNPRAYINKVAATGGLQKGDLAGGQAGQVAETAERINAREAATGGTNPLTKKVVSELGAGAAGAGEGAGAGGLMKMLGLSKFAGLGAAGAVVGGGAAAYGAVQEGGAIYQGLKNMGSVRGGGAAEGAGYEMNIRAMAMNPFISTDQARQIVQQGLKEGYTGKEFDTVTQFVASNLKGMNMDISQSFELMKKNVKEGGQSIESLNLALAGLKESSKTGYTSLPDLLKSYQQTSSALISSGTGGTAASATAASAAQMFANNPAVAKDSGGQLVQAFGSPTGMAFMREQGGLTMPPGSEGLLPGAMAYKMGPNAQLQGASGVIKGWAMQIWHDNGSPDPPAPGEDPSTPFANAMYLWSLRLQAMNIPWATDQPTVRQYFIAYVTNQDPAKAAEKKSAESNKAALVPHGKAAVQQVFDTAALPVKSTVGAIVGTARAFGGAVADLATGKWQGASHYEDQAARASRPFTDNMNPADMQSGALSSIQSVYGAKGIQYMDASGHPISLDQANPRQMAQLQSGEIKLKPKGAPGGGSTLAEMQNMTPDQLRGLVGGGSTKVSGELQITISPEAQRAGVQAPAKVQLSNHEQEANSAYSNSTPNNPPPGQERPRSRY